MVIYTDPKQIRAQKAGLVKTKKKARASRENGKLGGRPREKNVSKSALIKRAYREKLRNKNEVDKKERKIKKSSGQT